MEIMKSGILSPGPRFPQSHAEMLINSLSTGDHIQYCTMREHWTLTLRDTINGTNRVIYEGDHSVRSLKLSPNGCRVASLVTRTVIYVWDTYTGRFLGRSPENTREIKSFVFSPEGNRLIIHHFDVVKLWNIEEDNLVTL